MDVIAKSRKGETEKFREAEPTSPFGEMLDGAIERGRRDFRVGKKLEECPFPSGSVTGVAWVAGYADERDRS
jgi:hypothetical protein